MPPNKDVLQDILTSTKAISSRKNKKGRSKTNLAICFPMRCLKPSDSFCEGETIGENCQRLEQNYFNKKGNDDFSIKKD